MAIAQTKTAPSIETKKLPLSNRMLALEPRYVFDAALATELHEASDGRCDAARRGG